MPRHRDETFTENNFLHSRLEPGLEMLTWDGPRTGARFVFRQLEKEVKINGT